MTVISGFPRRAYDIGDTPPANEALCILLVDKVHCMPQSVDFVSASDATRSVDSIHGVKWRHRIYGHDTIAILWV